MVVESSTGGPILSQEAYGILLLPLHSNRIDCCLSPRCVWAQFVEVIRATDHDDSFVFSCLNSGTELALRKWSTSCCHSAVTAGRTLSSQIRVLLLLFRALLNTCVCLRTIQLKTSVRRTWQLEARRSPNKHPRTGSQEDSVDIAALWIVLLIASAHAWIRRWTQ